MHNEDDTSLKEMEAKVEEEQLDLGKEKSSNQKTQMMDDFI